MSHYLGEWWGQGLGPKESLYRSWYTEKLHVKSQRDYTASFSTPMLVFLKPLVTEIIFKKLPVNQKAVWKLFLWGCWNDLPGLCKEDVIVIIIYWNSLSPEFEISFSLSLNDWRLKGYRQHFKCVILSILFSRGLSRYTLHWRVSFKMCRHWTQPIFWWQTTASGNRIFKMTFTFNIKLKCALYPL